MADTIRETTIYPAKIKLEAFDQYNDYSVIFDYRLTVDDKSVGYFRSWNVGTDHSKAVKAYDTAVSAIFMAQARAFTQEAA